MRNLAILTSLLIALSVLGASSPILAQPKSTPEKVTGEQQERARAAFARGIELRDQDRCHEALQYFEESDRLMPSVGALLNQARCRHRLGQLATAFFLFQKTAKRAARMGDEREQDARTEASRLADMVSYMKLVVSDERPEGLRIRRGEVEIDAKHWDQRRLIDPGTYQFSATAPGYLPWQAEVAVDRTGREMVLFLPRLVRAPDPESEKESRRRGPSWFVRWRVQRNLALTTAGLGAAALAVGGLYAYRARTRWQGAVALCDEGLDGCQPDAVQRSHDARVLADRSTILVASGALAVGVGGLLWWLERRSGKTRFADERRTHLRPLVGPDTWGLTAATRF